MLGLPPAELIITEALNEIQRSKAAGVAPYLELCLDELLAVRSQIYSQKVKVDLAAVISTGRANGKRGHLDTTTISLHKLTTSLEAAEKLAESGVDEVALQFIRTTRAVIGLRTALVRRDWEAIAGWLEAYPGKDYCALVSLEVEETQAHLDDIRIVRALEAALATGGLADLTAVFRNKKLAAPLSALDMGHTAAAAALPFKSGSYYPSRRMSRMVEKSVAVDAHVHFLSAQIKTSELEAAIHKAQEVGNQNSEHAQQLLNSAEIILAIRKVGGCEWGRSEWLAQPGGRTLVSAPRGVQRCAFRRC